MSAPMSRERTLVFSAACAYLPGAHFRVSYEIDGPVTYIALYRDALSASIAKVDGFLGEDFFRSLSDEQRARIYQRIAEAEATDARLKRQEREMVLAEVRRFVEKPL